MSDVEPPRRESWFPIAIFCAALVAQFYCTTLNWTAGFMPGQEFRQAQTAIISYYIDRQDNFSPLYETPVVGKPWVSILLEVPIYEWSVVGLSRASGLRHVMAARVITLSCFYLMFPALYLLLGRLGISRPRRLLILALILTCPVYIFYSRAFMMDSMAVMASAWFLLGFVRTMDERRWSWLTLTIFAGIGAIMVKNFILAIWMLPAAGYGLWMLACDVRQRRGGKAVARTILWGAATVVPALLVLRWWINLTDPLKAAHSSAWLFTSKNLSLGNWGLFDFRAWVSPKVWGALADRWRETIMPPWLIGGLLIAGLALFPRIRRQVLGLAGLFFLAQLLFPYAYAYQDYYFYSCAIFLLAALGLVLGGLLDSGLPRWCCWPLLLVPFGAQLATYWHGYHTDQMVHSNGGLAYTEALRMLTPPKSVIVIAGQDWSAIAPFYSQRKALMIRNGLEHDAAYLHRAFDDLAGEDVSALVLTGRFRSDHKLLDLAADRFDLDTRAPAFSERDVEVYLKRAYTAQALKRLQTSEKYLGLKLGSLPEEKEPASLSFDVTPEMARQSFQNVLPMPFRGHFEMGANYLTVNDETVLSAHPRCALSLHAPADATEIRWVFGIRPEAYERSGDKTDGVEFAITGETPGGVRRRIFDRVLDPAHRMTDRGKQTEIISYRPLRGEVLTFSTHPNLSLSYDWAYWAFIDVR